MDSKEDSLSITDHLRLAENCLKSGDVEQCLHHCAATLSSNPDDLEALYVRGQAYLSQKNLDLASADFKRILDVDPRHAKAAESLIHVKVDAFLDKVEEQFEWRKNTATGSCFVVSVAEFWRDVLKGQDTPEQLRQKIVILLTKLENWERFKPAICNGLRETKADILGEKSLMSGANKEHRLPPGFLEASEDQEYDVLQQQSYLDWLKKDSTFLSNVHILLLAEELDITIVTVGANTKPRYDVNAANVFYELPPERLFKGRLCVLLQLYGHTDWLKPLSEEAHSQFVRSLFNGSIQKQVMTLDTLREAAAASDTGFQPRTSAPSVSSCCAELLSKKSSAKGLMEILTQDTIKHIVPSTIRQCDSLRQAQLDATTATSLTALNELRSWKGFAWTLFKLARLLRDVSNVRHFCTSLKSVLAAESSRSFKDVAKVCLRFLCSMLPKLSGQLSSHDVLSLFDAADAAYIQSQKLKPFDIGELKELPQGLQTAANRMPAGFLRDGCCEMIARSQQLIALNEAVICGELLAQAESDTQSTNAGASSVALKLEDLLVRFAAWHSDFVRHTSATTASPITRQLTASVKAAVADAQKENAFQPSAEQLLQIASFLVNTREWEYLLGGCRNIISRLVDFSKLIAALCYEIARNGDTIAVLTEELYKFHILTLIDSVQIKRSATGQPISLARESNELINRSQLMSYTRLLKEPLTLSVLMSFYVKTYNSTTLGVLNPIACEHLEFWPARAEKPTNLNVEYLCELIQICIGNATPTNAFCLRAAGDFYFGTSQSPSLALGCYLNAVLACTQGLTLNGLPANVVDATMIQRMAKCCAKCKYHTQEALLHQLMETPDFAAALKAFEQPDTYDSTDEYYALIWDMNFLELLVYALRKQNYEAKMEVALRYFECLELNAANLKKILAIAA